MPVLVGLAMRSKAEGGARDGFTRAECFRLVDKVLSVPHIDKKSGGGEAATEKKAKKKTKKTKKAAAEEEGGLQLKQAETWNACLEANVGPLLSAISAAMAPVAPVALVASSAAVVEEAEDEDEAEEVEVEGGKKGKKGKKNLNPKQRKKAKKNEKKNSKKVKQNKTPQPLAAKRVRVILGCLHRLVKVLRSMGVVEGGPVGKKAAKAAGGAAPACPFSTALCDEWKASLGDIHEDVLLSHGCTSLSRPVRQLCHQIAALLGLSAPADAIEGGSGGGGAGGAGGAGGKKRKKETPVEAVDEVGEEAVVKSAKKSKKGKGGGAVKTEAAVSGGTGKKSKRKR